MDIFNWKTGTYRYEVDIDDCILQSIGDWKTNKRNVYKGPRVSGDRYNIKKICS